MNSFREKLRAVQFMVGSAFLPVGSSAQQIWLPDAPGRTLSIEMLRPKMDRIDLSSSSYAAFFTFRLPADDGTRLVVEIPYAQCGDEGDFFGDSGRFERTAGNPYVGFEKRGKDCFICHEYGIRIPVMSKKWNFARYIGPYFDYDRRQAFVPGSLTILMAWSGTFKKPSGLLFKFRMGPEIWMINDGYREGRRAMLDYSGQIGFDADCFFLSGGFSGRIGTQAVENQLGFNAGCRLGRLWPVVHFRIPLGIDLRRYVDQVFGLACVFLIH